MGTYRVPRSTGPFSAGVLPYHSHVSGKEVRQRTGSPSCLSSSSSSFCSSSNKMRSHSPSSHPPILPFCPPVLTELPQLSPRAVVLSGHSRAGRVLLPTSSPAVRGLLSSLAGSESHHLTISPCPSPPHRLPHHLTMSLNTPLPPSTPHCLPQHLNTILLNMANPSFKI